jgi:hypothetical protein
MNGVPFEINQVYAHILVCSSRGVLLWRLRHRPYVDFYLLPFCTLDKGESAEEALKSTALIHLGLFIRHTTPWGRYLQPDQGIVHLIHTTRTAGTIRRCGEHLLDATWIARDQVAEPALICPVLPICMEMLRDSMLGKARHPINRSFDSSIIPPSVLDYEEREVSSCFG